MGISMRIAVVMVILVIFVGCQAPMEGTQEAAAAYLSAELDKWIMGQDSEAETLDFNTHLIQVPLSYELHASMPDKADLLAFDRQGKPPKDRSQCPAYRFHVTLRYRSQAETMIEKVASYNLTWNIDEKRWYISERR